jgi:ribosomal protein S18 acetylase RimI-like enzyme
MRYSSAHDMHHLGTLWLLDLDSSSTIEIAPRVLATFQRIGAEETFSLAQAMGRDDTTEVLQRFARGRRCYIAQVGDTLAAYGWVSFEEEEIGEIRLRIRLAEGEAYIWDCATLPAYRGLHLYPALLAYIVSELRAEGLRRIWIGADSDNLASQTGMALAGFQPIANLVIACVVALRQLWLQGQPGVPEHLVMDARRALFGERALAWQEAASKTVNFDHPT